MPRRIPGHERRPHEEAIDKALLIGGTMLLVASFVVVVWRALS